ncbi:MAG: outer membrane protein transport protein [Myxococcota bacterium]
MRTAFAIDLVTVLALSARAGAQPLATPRVGGGAFSGPAEPDVTAIYWNPAAIGGMRGLDLYIDGALRLDRGVLARDPIDTTTGAPASAGTAPDDRRAFPTVRTSDATPDLFAGATWDFGTKKIVVGLASYAPYVERLHAADDWPGRYYRQDLDWRHVYVTGAVAYKATDNWYVGIAPSIAWSWLRLRFARDTALDRPSAATAHYESDDQVEDLAIDVGTRDVAWSFGTLVRVTSRFDIGATWIHPPAGGLRAEGDATAGGPAHDGRTLAGVATATWSLPDQVLVGVDVRPTPRWQFGAWGRWSNWSIHDRLEIDLSSAAFGDADVPSSVLFWRGFRDTFGVQTTGAYRPLSRLRLLASALVESPLTDESRVNPAQAGGPRIDGLVGAEVSLPRGVRMSLSYGLVAFADRDPSDSGFDPRWAVGCQDAALDIDDPNCRRLVEGRALPTPSGSYERTVHRIGVGLGWDIW